MIQTIRNFFWLCSGVNIEQLKKIESDYIKYASIGATVFFTGVLASLSGGYAMHYVFNNYLVTIPFAILWGLIIFNLDRYIVSSLIKPMASGKGAFVDFFRELPPALPRFLLAAIIAVAVSNPIELRLFQKEIDSLENKLKTARLLPFENKKKHWQIELEIYKRIFERIR